MSSLVALLCLSRIHHTPAFLIVSACWTLLLHEFSLKPTKDDEWRYTGSRTEYIFTGDDINSDMFKLLERRLGDLG